jgi:hypothetical protein
MKKYFAIVPGATAGTLLAGAASAEEPYTGPLCPHNANQLSQGFYCTSDEDASDISREIGGGARCQDATVTTLTVYAYNHRGNLQEERTVTSEPEESGWGSSYPKPATGCNYPT